MVWIQHELTLDPRPRGFHLVTAEVERAVPELSGIKVGIATVFIKHTSASLTLNENASPDVRRDFEEWANETVPVADGRLALGTWQGIYLCEHRDGGGPRSVLVTVWGEER